MPKFVAVMRRAPALFAPVLLLSACSDSTGPVAEVSEAEATALVGFLAEIGVAPDVPAFSEAAPGEVQPALATSFSYTRTRECPGGGSVTVTGESQAERDRETRIVAVEWEATQSHDGCTFTRGEHTITVNGSVDTDGSASYQLPETSGEGRQVLSYQATRSGHLEWTRGERSRSCDIDLTTTYDAAADAFVTTGTVCGREVNHTRPRGGAHG